MNYYAKFLILQTRFQFYPMLLEIKQFSCPNQQMNLNYLTLKYEKLVAVSLQGVKELHIKISN